jgi:hypothetical protein
MRNQIIKMQKLIFSVLLISVLASVNTVYSEEAKPDQKLFTAAAFGLDGKLWRVTPSQDKIEVDMSSDGGMHFGKPVHVNRKPQAMNFWDENPPSIAVDKHGRVYVLYFADDKQEFTSFLSYSDDGKHFSDPVKVSSKADKSIHYQTEMLVDNTDKLHFMWHDVRDESEYKKSGGGDLSIYYLAAERDKLIPLPQDHRLAKNICSCCRSAMALDKHGNPVILARFVYLDSIRDHGLIKVGADGNAAQTRRVTYDMWKLDGCPTHGPALSISATGRYHMAWFSQGSNHSGLLYAWSDNEGNAFSKPFALGDDSKLPGRPDVLALGNKVAVVWKEFDGKLTTIKGMLSSDGGLTWPTANQLAASPEASAHPALISDGKRIFLVWNSSDKGFQLISVD